MYITINNRYSTIRWKITVTLHRAMETASSASAQPLNRDYDRGIRSGFLIESVLIGAQQGVQTVTVWISGNSAVTTK